MPLSDIGPREGRYKKVLPALIVFSLYLGLLVASRGASLIPSLNQISSMVLIHLIFITASVYLYRIANIRT